MGGWLPRRPRFLSVLSVLAVAPVLVLIANPAAAGSPSHVLSPPYLHATTLLAVSTSSHRCTFGGAAANASADPVTGNASAYACARANANHTSVNATAEAGFSFRFQVATGGNHIARVNWSGSDSGAGGCVTIFVFVINSTGGSIVGSAGYGGSCTGSIHIVNSFSALEVWNGSLLAHHVYFLQTYLFATANSGFPAGYHSAESVQVTGTLDRVQIG